MDVASLSIQLIKSIDTIRTFVRDVKDAPKELERLADLLERLEALLRDVRDVMERQTSLQGQQFPAPSMTIFKCLQSCEKTLQPLRAMSEKFKTSPSHLSSPVAKFKKEIKLAFKAKEIADFERRIEQEINHLHATLGMNSTAILTSMLPVLLHKQQTMLAICSKPSMDRTPNSQSAMPARRQSLGTPSTPCSTLISRQVAQVRSPLEKLGLYRRKITRYLHSEAKDTDESITNYRKEIISEEHELRLIWRLVGYGVTWTQHSYGNILPSLSVYPVVSRWGKDIRSLILFGNIRDIQRMFSSGTIHPFSRNYDDFSLLHLAAWYHRADVIRLLQGYGVRPAFTSSGISPFRWAFTFPFCNDLSNTIDTYRCLLDGEDLIDEFGSTVWDEKCLPALYWGSECAQWLWQQAGNLYLGTDSLMFRHRIMSKTWAGTVWNFFFYEELSEIAFPDFDFDMEIMDDIQSGRCQLLKAIFDDNCWSSFRSFDVGAIFVNWLSRLGLDVEMCVNKEIELMRGCIVTDWGEEKKIIFEGSSEQGWILGFEWVFDHQAPGYLVISEFRIFADLPHYLKDWPYRKRDDSLSFDDFDREDPKWESRFNRRIATKARKERARTGQKRPKSKMPGSWS